MAGCSLSLSSPPFPAVGLKVVSAPMLATEIGRKEFLESHTPFLLARGKDHEDLMLRTVVLRLEKKPNESQQMQLEYCHGDVRWCQQIAQVASFSFSGCVGDVIFVTHTYLSWKESTFKNVLNQSLTRNQSLRWVFTLRSFFSPFKSRWDQGSWQSQEPTSGHLPVRGRRRSGPSPFRSCWSLANDVRLSFTQAKGASWGLYPHLYLPISKAVSSYCTTSPTYLG